MFKAYPWRLSLYIIMASGLGLFYWHSNQILDEDSLSLSASAPTRFIPRLSTPAETKAKLESYLVSLQSIDEAGVDWKQIYGEWFEYAEGFFQRANMKEEDYTAYVELYLSHKRKIKLWRESCQHEFFPEINFITDPALVLKEKKTENFKEMMNKISRGQNTIDLDYQLALEQLLGARLVSFKKLHTLYGKEIQAVYHHKFNVTF